METDNKKAWMIGIAIIFSVIFGMWVFSPMEVIVTGTGKISVPASTATFNVTVASSKDSANDSLIDLRAKIDAVKKTLANINIGAENITESQVTLTPAAAVVANGKGFQAVSTLTVKTVNVPMVAEIMVNMYASGATVVSQSVVSVEDEAKLEKEALKDALKQAKASLSDTVGFRPIKKIVSIQQASSGNSATSTKIVEDNKGSVEVVKAVSVTYRVW